MLAFRWYDTFRTKDDLLDQRTVSAAPPIDRTRRAAKSASGDSRPTGYKNRVASESSSHPARKKNIIETIRGGYVTTRRPDGLIPEANLSRAERIENFDILCEAIDHSYSFFEHKNVDWKEIQRRYRPKVKAARSTKEFYRLLYQLVRELKDFHSWLSNYKDGAKFPRYTPQVSVRRIEGKAVITHVAKNSQAYRKALRPGAVIIGVDRLSVQRRVKKLCPLLPVSSSERNLLDTAYRRLLHGKKDSTVSVTVLRPGQRSPITLRLKRTRGLKERAGEPNFSVEKGKFVWFGIHPSGYGYIRILTFRGRMEIADEFDRALEKLKDSPAIMIDIRDNLGGFGTSQPRIIGRFLTERTKAGVIYRKNGLEHSDFRKRQHVYSPKGDWQYTRPIALLINVRTGSASDLFACNMISTGRPITVGGTTHGNVTGGGVYVVLPCNLVVRVSYGYVCDATGKVIEGNGNVPQVHAELTIQDIVNRTDSVIDRAVEALREKVSTVDELN